MRPGRGERIGALPPILSRIARSKKFRYFFRDVPKSANILEIGCGDKWLGHELARNGWTHYTGLDLVPPADVLGDIRAWRTLLIPPESFDIIVAFELVEHVDCFEDMYRLLKPDGRLFLTSPRPEMDWLCKILEALRLTQKRSSPHQFLVDFRTIRQFEPLRLRSVGLIAQWGVFRKPAPVDKKKGRPKPPLELA
jgi:2-polyprenyl-3-methyl-5-hydroxy-6-metoxy-1,4-benzoquinol methylase